MFFSAQQEGLLCEEAGQHNDNVKYTGYCNYHYQKLVSSGQLEVKGQDLLQVFQ